MANYSNETELTDLSLNKNGSPSSQKLAQEKPAKSRSDKSKSHRSQRSGKSKRDSWRKEPEPRRGAKKQDKSSQIARSDHNFKSDRSKVRENNSDGSHRKDRPKSSRKEGESSKTKGSENSSKRGSGKSEKKSQSDSKKAEKSIKKTTSETSQKTQKARSSKKDHVEKSQKTQKNSSSKIKTEKSNTSLKKQSSKKSLSSQRSPKRGSGSSIKPKPADSLQSLHAKLSKSVPLFAPSETGSEKPPPPKGSFKKDSVPIDLSSKRNLEDEPTPKFDLGEFGLSSDIGKGVPAPEHSEGFSGIVDDLRTESARIRREYYTPNYSRQKESKNLTKDTGEKGKEAQTEKSRKTQKSSRKDPGEQSQKTQRSSSTRNTEAKATAGPKSEKSNTSLKKELTTSVKSSNTSVRETSKKSRAVSQKSEDSVGGANLASQSGESMPQDNANATGQEPSIKPRPADSLQELPAKVSKSVPLFVPSETDEQPSQRITAFKRESFPVNFSSRRDREDDPSSKFDPRMFGLTSEIGKGQPVPEHSEGFSGIVVELRQESARLRRQYYDKPIIPSFTDRPTSTEDLGNYTGTSDHDFTGNIKSEDSSKISSSTPGGESTSVESSDAMIAKLGVKSGQSGSDSSRLSGSDQSGIGAVSGQAANSLSSSSGKDTSSASVENVGAYGTIPQTESPNLKPSMLASAKFPAGRTVASKDGTIPPVESPNLKPSLLASAKSPAGRTVASKDVSIRGSNKSESMKQMIISGAKTAGGGASTGSELFSTAKTVPQVPNAEISIRSSQAPPAIGGKMVGGEISIRSSHAPPTSGGKLACKTVPGSHVEGPVENEVIEKKTEKGFGSIMVNCSRDTYQMKMQTAVVVSQDVSKKTAPVRAEAKHSFVPPNKSRALAKTPSGTDMTGLVSSRSEKFSRPTANSASCREPARNSSGDKTKVIRSSQIDRTGSKQRVQAVTGGRELSIKTPSGTDISGAVSSLSATFSKQSVVPAPSGEGLPKQLEPGIIAKCAKMTKY